MSKSIVLLYNLSNLYEILSEINNLFNFEIHSVEGEEKLKNFLYENKNTLVVLSRSKISQLPQDQNIILSQFPIKIFSLIESINIVLLKRKFINQSEIQINEYKLDVNSRLLIFRDKKLKLTQKETEIILFIKNYKKDVSINNLKKNVWGHSSILDTHTVETHVYRLRKKVKDFFNDNNFIISTHDGYKI